jgi:hypothetical protein
MRAFNVVRFRVKPGNEERFVEMHRKVHPEFKGFRGGNLISTGERTFCFVGEWSNMTRLADARPEMIAFLDQFRDMLEDLGGDLGVSDPVSGESVAKLSAPKARKGKKKKKSAKGKKGKGKDKKKNKSKKKKKGR